MKQIIYSQHAEYKIKLLKVHGINVDKPQIEIAIKNPEKIESGYKNRLIAQKEFDSDHVLRIVYEETENQINVITLYPGRKVRYEKNKI